MTHEANGKDDTTRESDLAREATEVSFEAARSSSMKLNNWISDQIDAGCRPEAREETGKSDLMERLRAHLRRCIPFSEASALLTEAANALATVEAEIQGRDNTIDALEFLKNQAEARALTAETRLSGMVEAVKGGSTAMHQAIHFMHSSASYSDDERRHVFDCLEAARSAALSVLADIEGNTSSVAKSGSTPTAKSDVHCKSEEELQALLKDPVAVHLNMLRGSIAKPTPSQIGHLYRGEEAEAVIAEVRRQNPLDPDQVQS